MFDSLGQLYIKMRYIYILNILLYVEVSNSFVTPVVQTSQGKLRGLSVLGQNRYLSIPYATSERFQLPREPTKWNGIFNAINPFVRCPQKVLSFNTGSENCLFLDLYTPENVKQPVKLPVMVFFHGGGYSEGSKELYGPQFLVSKDVVAVIINYRLGALGFLCLNGISNLGLRDQVAALKWIKKNIALFGGDPENITLCGQSAGGSSAALHMLSELSKDLFHKAILMSGTALSTWALNAEPLTPALEDARKISPARTERDVFDIFTRAPLPTLLSATYDNSVNPRYFRYSPCVDSNFTDPFFRDTPYNILKSGHFNKVPVIVGFTDTEGGYFYRLLSKEWVKQLNDNFNDMIPSAFSSCSNQKRQEIGAMMRYHYFGNQTINYRTTIGPLISYYSDWIAYGAVNAFSKTVAQFSDQPVYNFQFSYLGGLNLGKALSGADYEGTTHADDLFYIFKPFQISLLLQDEDKLMINRMTTLIKNFMLHGDPTPKKTSLIPLKWPSASKTLSNILVLDKHMRVIDQPRRRQRGEYFMKMLCTYGRSGYVPCESAEMCQSAR